MLLLGLFALQKVNSHIGKILKQSYGVFHVTRKGKWKLLSCVWLFVAQWTVESMEFSRLEYWSGLPCPPPGDLPNPGWTQVSRIAGGFFTSAGTREAQEYWSGQPNPSQADLPNPGIDRGLLHCRWILYQLSYQGSPDMWVKHPESTFSRPSKAFRWLRPCRHLDYNLIQDLQPESLSSHPWIPKSQLFNLINVNCCFRPLSLGVICYTLMHNQHTYTHFTNHI